MCIAYSSPQEVINRVLVSCIYYLIYTPGDFRLGGGLGVLESNTGSRTEAAEFVYLVVRYHSMFSKSTNNLESRHVVTPHFGLENALILIAEVLLFSYTGSRYWCNGRGCAWRHSLLPPSAPTARQQAGN